MDHQLIGRVLGNNFKVMNLLGRGGMGSVYLAEDLALGRQVAVKVLESPELSSPTNWERFKREGQTLSKLDHQHIVKVLSFGKTEQGDLFLVMEYIRGQSLAQLLSLEAPLNWRRAVEIVVQVCNALSYVHSQGGVHRDLKPHNIMLVEGERSDFVKLLDFGLASFVSSSLQKLTKTGALIGSPQYMSPEGTQGAVVDGRSDIYSLGCILYECLTGRLPFEAANSIEFLCKHRTEMPKRLNDLFQSAGIPAELELVIFKALQKEPARRFQSMSEFENTLRLIIGGRSDELNFAGLKLGSQDQQIHRMKLPLALAFILVLVFAILVTHHQSQVHDQGKTADTPGAASRSQKDEREYERSLARYEKAFGPDSPEIEKQLNDLAKYYYQQHRFAEAEPLLKRLVAIREKVLGPIHAEVADTLIRLADCYSAKGKYAEAEPLYKRSLAIREKVLGPMHEYVADTSIQLADCYSARGKYAEAEPLYKRSLKISEKALGPNHARVAAALNALACCYEHQGKQAEAEPLLKRAHVIRGINCGPAT
jgi:serine/threonine protein kinase